MEITEEKSTQFDVVDIGFVDPRKSKPNLFSCGIL